MKKLIIAALALPLALSAFGATGGGTTTVAASIPAHGTPTIALSNLGAGLITNGTHSYKITFIDASGESLPSSSKSSVLTTATATNGKVNVTIPAFPAGATGANVYRTVSGDAGDYKLVNASPVLAAGTYVDNIADGSLGAVAPTTNTTGLAQAADLTVALAGAGAGLVTTGTHSYKLQFNDAVGHSLQSANKSNVVTTDEATNGQVNVTVPAFPAGAVSANVYRTVAGDAGDYKLVNASPILAAGTYVDNIADASLGAALTATNTSGIAQPGAPTVALANLGAGLCTDGAHNVKIAFVTSTGISTLSSAAAGAVTTASATNGKITVTVTASGRSEVSSVNIYMTKAGGSTYYLAASGVANSNGDTVLNIADASLVTEAPTTDTASEAANTTITATSGKHFRSLWVHNLDSTNKVYITLDGSDPVTSATVGSWSIAAGATWGPIELPQDKDGNDVQYITMRFDTTGGVVQYWYREDR